MSTTTIHGYMSPSKGLSTNTHIIYNMRGIYIVKGDRFIKVKWSQTKRANRKRDHHTHTHIYVDTYQLTRCLMIALLIQPQLPCYGIVFSNVYGQDTRRMTNLPDTKTTGELIYTYRSG
uniref:Uncharacterized protein n=1 Tax=Trichobilharzia regenti TaxID=157069 RepID=A0AA85IUI9_TRIRE|nr:unnamed protein product [Trichobilharzia regenti]